MGLFSRLFRMKKDTDEVRTEHKPDNNRNMISDQRQSNETKLKDSPVIIRIKCNYCGKQFVLGEDTVVTSAVIPAEGALTKMSHPDSIAPMDWNTLSGSPRQAQLDIIGALIGSKMLAKITGSSWNRQWRCYSCNEVQPYRLYSDDWDNTIE